MSTTGDEEWGAQLERFAPPTKRLHDALIDVGEYGHAEGVREFDSDEAAYLALLEHDPDGRHQAVVDEGYELGVLK